MVTHTRTKLQVYLSILDILVDIRHYKIKSIDLFTLIIFLSLSLKFSVRPFFCSNLENKCKTALHYQKAYYLCIIKSLSFLPRRANILCCINHCNLCKLGQVLESRANFFEIRASITKWNY